MMRRMVRLLTVMLIMSFLLSQLPMMSYAAANSNNGGQRVIVSMGDSYSSGEGVEPFYGQEKNEKEKAYDPDFLAHRSTNSWPGRLKLSGVSGTMKDHKDDNWYFVAASGAESKHFSKSFNKPYDRGKVSNNEEVDLDPQLNVFDELKAKGLSADYVTMTIGGNDVGFGDIIASSVTEIDPFLNPTKLIDQLNTAWAKFDTTGMKKIKKAYGAVRAAAGPDTVILVVGYPRLIAENAKAQPYFSPAEIVTINSNVNLFNATLASIVSSMKDENIIFVPVDDAFDGHEAYSKNGVYINPLSLNNAQDLKDFDIKDIKHTLFSAYSMHPNGSSDPDKMCGVKVYADCVQAVIDDIEKEKKQNDQGDVSQANATTTVAQGIVMPIEKVLSASEYIDLTHCLDCCGEAGRTFTFGENRSATCETFDEMERDSTTTSYTVSGDSVVVHFDLDECTLDYTISLLPHSKMLKYSLKCEYEYDKGNIWNTTGFMIKSDDLDFDSSKMPERLDDTHWISKTIGKYDSFDDEGDLFFYIENNENVSYYDPILYGDLTVTHHTSELYATQVTDCIAQFTIQNWGFGGEFYIEEYNGKMYGYFYDNDTGDYIAEELTEADT